MSNPYKSEQGHCRLPISYCNWAETPVRVAGSREEDVGDLGGAGKMREGKGLGGSTWHGRSCEGRKGMALLCQKVSVLGAYGTVQVSTCLRRSNASCQVENITSPDNFILLNNLLAQSKENQCNRVRLPVQQEILPGTPCHPMLSPKGTSWCAQKRRSHVGVAVAPGLSPGKLHGTEGTLGTLVFDWSKSCG